MAGIRIHSVHEPHKISRQMLDRLSALQFFSPLSQVLLEQLEVLQANGLSYFLLERTIRLDQPAFFINPRRRRLLSGCEKE